MLSGHFESPALKSVEIVMHHVDRTLHAMSIVDFSHSILELTLGP